MSHKANSKRQPVASASESTSASLLERVKAHDPLAWQSLVDIYAPMVYRWCRHAGLQSEDAADIGQDVFSAVANYVGAFSPRPSQGGFRAWMWTLTQNKVRDYFRRTRGKPQAQGGTEAQQRMARIPENADETTDVTHRPSEEADVVHRALDAVRPRFEARTWQAFWRTTVDRQSAPEVADELRMSVQAVYQAKYRVLQRLRAELKDLVPWHGR
jgi:RNA polymerase sigma-70 factor (ECF subfamily)